MKRSAHPPQSKANRLIHSTSPYLLQHAYNPVDWHEWGKDALEKARREEKPILVSIGYSSCHWCHVMERESFENADIAAIMNKNFIAIKVDREERPDVDQVYMDAIQAMGQNGGWPLNVFLTSDQKPFYGGTYFPPEAWSQVLTQVARVYEEKRQEVEESAQQLTDIIAKSEVIKYELRETESPFDVLKLDKIYGSIAKKFDHRKGGFNRAPKFPMPGQWLFLLRYFHVTENQEALRQVELTLNEMARGGIYDQIGGGFSRYSVDANWLVPHFEKMLYDNGQLVSLYSEAYLITRNEMYKEVVYHIIDWLEREMTSEEGGFYSALDADSEGEEGKFYVWTTDELKEVVGPDADLIQEYYNAEVSGNWESEKNILHKTVPDEAFADRKGLTVEELKQKVQKANDLLLQARNQRVRPGLDDKCLSGWNGIMLRGLMDAYEAFDEPKFLNMALANAAFLDEKMIVDSQLLRSYKDKKSAIDGFLEDYAFVIDAFLALYQNTFDELWLGKAKMLADHAIEQFYDHEEQLFFFTGKHSGALIARKKEIFDNVIPASNSQMAKNLYALGIIYDNREYQSICTSMMNRLSESIEKEPAYLFNWGILGCSMAKGTAEICIVGENVEQFRKALAKKYYPQKMVMGTRTDSTLPLLEDKPAVNNETTIYVCYNKACQRPVRSVEQAFEQLV